MGVVFWKFIETGYSSKVKIEGPVWFWVGLLLLRDENKKFENMSFNEGEA